MVRGDVKAWLQANGWRLVKSVWVRGELCLEVDSSMTDPDLVVWVLRYVGGGYVASGRDVTKKLYELLNRFD